MRPYSLADEWGESRSDVLKAFLHAVPAGLVELRWAIICPSCLTSAQQARALDEIGAEGHCQLCDITFDLTLDRAVEAMFVPHPSVRRVPDGLFCIGGPARTPHVLVQSSVTSKGERRLEVPSKPGALPGLRARRRVAATLEVDAEGTTAAKIALGASGLSPSLLHVAPGAELSVVNEQPDSRHVKIERLDFASAAATAHEVATTGEFRTLFSTELLKRDTPLKVSRAAVLFSDLHGVDGSSTRTSATPRRSGWSTTTSTSCARWSRTGQYGGAFGRRRWATR